MQQAEDIELFELLTALQKVEFDREGQSCNVSSELLNQLYRGFHRSAGRQQIVDEDHILAGLNRIEMNFQRIGAVFQVVSHASHGRRQLARLAYRYKSRIETISERRAEDEAASLDAEDEVDIFADVMRGQGINHLREANPVFQQRRDVVKEDARLGEVGYGADERLQRLAIERMTHSWGYQAPSI